MGWIDLLSLKFFVPTADTRSQAVVYGLGR